MRAIRRSAVAALAGMLLAASAAAGPDVKAELAELQKQFQEAQAAWQKDRSDASKEPHALFLPKFLDLAKRGKGSNEGVRAAAQAVMAASRTREAKKGMEEATALAVPAGLGQPAMAEFAQNLRFYGWAVGREKQLEVLRLVGEKAADPGAKATGLFGTAVLLIEDPQATAARKQEARTLLGRVLEEFPKSPSAGQAKGYVFEIEKLQVGMVAPDFEETDGDGVRFRLSEYRGKVVLLDFWGFW